MNDIDSTDSLLRFESVLVIFDGVVSCLYVDSVIVGLRYGDVSRLGCFVVTHLF